jgi:hypothetical protein
MKIFSRIAIWLAVVLVWSSEMLAADPSLDVSKLKAGDRLELQSGNAWEPVEFIEKISDNAARVRRRDRPVAVPVGKLRLARTDSPAADSKQPPKSSPDYPFAADDSNSPAPRTWMDRTGKFKAEAIFLRVEGANVILKRAGGDEISVALEKLSDADQKYVADQKKTKDKPPAERAEAPATAKPQNVDEPSIETTSTDYTAARQLDLRATSEWSYEPDVAPTKPLPEMRMPLGRVDFFERPQAILLAPQEKRAYVVLRNESPGNKEYVSRVLDCNLGAGKVEASGVFAVGFEPLDVSIDGSRVLARSTAWGSWKKSALRVYSREGKRVKAMCAWQPFAKPKAVGETTRAGQVPEVSWAALADNEHVLTASSDGDFVCWKVPELTPIYRTKLSSGSWPALSAGRKYWMGSGAGEIAIVRAADGELAGSLKQDSVPPDTLALRNDGLRLAGVWNNEIQVWDLQKREQIRDFWISGPRSGGLASTEWATDALLLVNGHVLVDVERRIPVWVYRHHLESCLLQGSRLLFIGWDNMLNCAAVPDKTVLDAVAKLNPEELLVVRPGVEVVVDIQAPGTADEIEAAKIDLQSRLENIGMKVAAQGDLHLVAAIEPGKTVTMHYRSWNSSPFDKGSEYSVATQTLSLSFKLAGDILWSYSTTSAPPGFLS